MAFCFIGVLSTVRAQTGAESQQENQPPSIGPTTEPAPGEEAVDISELMLVEPEVTRHTISISGDYLLGQGDVTVPVGFALEGGALPVDTDVFIPDRESDYFGGTFSYSLGQTWFVDLSYVQGDSQGNVVIPDFFGQNLPSDFQIDDQRYQVFLRYAFPALRGSRWSAYLRAGGTYVPAELRVTGLAVDSYSQETDTKDWYGNLGFGVSYYLFSGTRTRVLLQVEGEGFYGVREQSVDELLFQDFRRSTTLDNELIGGIARSTLRVEVGLGESRLFKVFADGGVQGQYTIIEYESSTFFQEDSFDELLWGPYARAGISYSF